MEEFENFEDEECLDEEIPANMKLKPIRFGHVTGNKLSDRKLKLIIGGYGGYDGGIGPWDWAECCNCNYTAFSSAFFGGPVFSGTGWFCAKQGSSNCELAILDWSSNICSQFDGGISHIDFFCLGFGEIPIKCL